LHLACFLTFFVNSVAYATVVVGLCGFSWALTAWAPFSLLGEEIIRLESDPSADPDYELVESQPLAASDAYGEEEEELPQLHLNQAVSSEQPLFSTSASSKSGVYLGIHNLFIVAPQFVITFLGTIIFAILEPGKSPELTGDIPPEGEERKVGVNAIAVILRIGGASALVAAWLSWKMNHR